MTLWTSAEAAAATKGRATQDWVCEGVSIDTRTLQPGDLFVALTAARDGHDFVAQALENGAAAALVSRIPEGLDETAPLLIVPDVLAGLEDLGRAARARVAAKIVAVTGSVGKTSTKEMLRKVLGGQGKTHASVASYNNHWGVPLTLARMPKDSDFGVIEIGMNHPGEIAPLAKMARPHVALVTIVAPAHLEAFDDLAGIAHEKASIFEGLEAGGIAIYNGDLDTSDILSKTAKTLASASFAFGESPDCDFQLSGVSIKQDVTIAQLTHDGQEALFKVAVPGRHFVTNASAVLASVKVLGLDQAIAISDLGQWEPGAGRGHREAIQLDSVETGQKIELIDDAYNANPASMAASLEVLATATVTNEVGRIARGRRVAYLGDMKELGSDEVSIHAGLAKLASMEQIDRVHCVGPLMRHLHKALPDEKRGRWCETSQEMAKGVARDLDAGDVVLAKGSLSTGMARIVDAIRKLGHPAGTENEGTS